MPGLDPGLRTKRLLRLHSSSRSHSPLSCSSPPSLTALLLTRHFTCRLVAYATEINFLPSHKKENINKQAPPKRKRGRGYYVGFLPDDACSSPKLRSDGLAAITRSESRFRFCMRNSASSCGTSFPSLAVEFLLAWEGRGPPRPSHAAELCLKRLRPLRWGGDRPHQAELVLKRLRPLRWGAGM